MLSDVQGQEEGVKFLRRVVEGRFASPLLLIGTPGVGRRFAVFQTAKEMGCTGSKNSDCDCLSCIQISQFTHPDICIVQAADDVEIGVEPIREMVASTYSYPSLAPARFCIIDGADRLTVAAANALLKTLEDPPGKALFFLLAEHQTKVIPTIRSRCGTIRFLPLQESLILSVLQRFESDPAKASICARLAEGSVERALQFVARGWLGHRSKLLTMVRDGLDGNLSSVFSTIDDLKDFPPLLRFLDHLVHDLLMATHDPSRILNQDMTEEIQGIRERLTPLKLSLFHSKLRQVQAQNDRTYINLPFHLKSAFASSLAGA